MSLFSSDALDCQKRQVDEHFSNAAVQPDADRDASLNRIQNEYDSILKIADRKVRFHNITKSRDGKCLGAHCNTNVWSNGKVPKKAAWAID